jgi:hypothetical protein
VNLVERSACHVCGENYLLRGMRYAQLIEIQDALDIREVINSQYPLEGPQRTCFNVVPMEECIFVCMACWYRNRNSELRRYAHAPLAAELKGFSIG